MEFGHAVFKRVLRQGPKNAIETIWDRNPPTRSKKNVVENGLGCCGIYSTPRFAVALVFWEGRQPLPRVLDRYPTKVFNSTLLSAIHIRRMREILLKSNHKRKFQTFGRGRGTVLEGGSRYHFRRGMGTLLHSQSSFEYRIINLYDFQEHSSNTHTRIHNHN